MKRTSTLLAALTSLLLTIPAAAQAKYATSDGELQLGVEAYKNAHYSDAVQHFEKAVDLDGSNFKARLYLATTYTSQYIPGVGTPENAQLAEHAIDQYQHVLDADTERTLRIRSAKGIAYLYMNTKMFDDAKKYYRMASDLDPDDPEPYYSVGVIDWTECYGARMQERAKLGMKPGENLDASDRDQKRICDDLASRNASIIEEGIDRLNKAINLRPDYDDAMAYINLMYREKADLECNNPMAREKDLKIADDWVDKTLTVKKAKARKSSVLTAPNPQ